MLGVSQFSLHLPSPPYVTPPNVTFQFHLCRRAWIWSSSHPLLDYLSLPNSKNPYHFDFPGVVRDVIEILGDIWNVNMRCKTNVWKSLLKLRMMKEGEEKLKEAEKKLKEGVRFDVAPWIEMSWTIRSREKYRSGLSFWDCLGPITLHHATSLTTVALGLFSIIRA